MQIRRRPPFDFVFFRLICIRGGGPPPGPLPHPPHPPPLGRFLFCRTTAAISTDDASVLFFFSWPRFFRATTPSIDAWSTSIWFGSFAYDECATIGSSVAQKRRALTELSLVLTELYGIGTGFYWVFSDCNRVSDFYLALNGFDGARQGLPSHRVFSRVLLDCFVILLGVYLILISFAFD